MAWTVSVSGSDKEQVKSDAVAAFDRFGVPANGTEEGNDINAVRDRALALIDELAPMGDRVYSVTAGGRRNRIDENVVYVTFNLSVAIRDPGR